MGLDMVALVQAVAIVARYGRGRFEIGQQMTIRETGSMSIQSYDQTLPFRVGGREVDSHHVEFDLGHQQQAYQNWFDRRFTRAAA
jgi:hypothetical protein